MMVEGSILTLGLFAWLFLRTAAQSEERQELLDFAQANAYSLDEARATRAVAAGRGDELRVRLAGDAAPQGRRRGVRAGAGGATRPTPARRRAWASRVSLPPEPMTDPSTPTALRTTRPSAAASAVEGGPSSVADAAAGARDARRHRRLRRSSSSPRRSRRRPRCPAASSDGGGAVAAPSTVGTLTPVKAAPATTLRNYLGQSVSLSQYRGKAVFVTFLYTHCPDVCPLIASNLHATQAALGAENGKVQMLAISVDPTGDTPASVAAFLKVHRLLGRMQYLIGSAAQLSRVWSAWNVGSARDAGSPELVNHTALVYGISGKGDVMTIYPADFKPSDLVHDAPLLAGQ